MITFKKSSIRLWRWVFLVLYALVIFALTVLGFTADDPDGWIWTLIYLAFFVLCQLIFILGTGRFELCRPIKRRRLLFPVVIASLMMAILVGTFTAALIELFDVHGHSWMPFVCWGMMFLSWIFWGLIFYIHSRDLQRLQVIRSLTRKLLAGSLIELLISMPMHIIVSRRAQCFAGIYTGMGVAAGIFVMLWAFGPGILLLFLREKKE